MNKEEQSAEAKRCLRADLKDMDASVSHLMLPKGISYVIGEPPVFATQPLHDLASANVTLALEHLLNQGISYGQVPNQFLWDRVAVFQVRDAGRTHPDLIIPTLPDEHFEWQFKCQ